MSHLEYEERLVQCKEKVYSTRIATSAVGGQSVWCEEKICVMRNVTSAVQAEKVCSIWKCCICKENIVQCEEKLYRIRRAISALGGKCVWCEEKVWSIRSVTSAV